jgi:hypothetical protein
MKRKYTSLEYKKWLLDAWTNNITDFCLGDARDFCLVDARDQDGKWQEGVVEEVSDERAYIRWCAWSSRFTLWVSKETVYPRNSVIPRWQDDLKVGSKIESLWSDTSKRKWAIGTVTHIDRVTKDHLRLWVLHDDDKRHQFHEWRKDDPRWTICPLGTHVRDKAAPPSARMAAIDAALDKDDKDMLLDALELEPEIVTVLRYMHTKYTMIRNARISSGNSLCQRMPLIPAPKEDFFAKVAYETCTGLKEDTFLELLEFFS